MSMSLGTTFDQARARRLQASIPASYIIHKEGSLCYIEATRPGSTDWNDPDDEEVIQYGIDTLYNAGGGVFGGTLFVKKASADYSINNDIICRNRVDILLERDACLLAGQALSPAMFNFENAAATTYFTKISGGRIEGNNLADRAFSFLDVTGNIFVEEMEVAGFTDSPVRLSGAWGIRARNMKVTAPTGAYCFDLTRDAAAHTGNHLNTFTKVHMIGGTNAYFFRINGDAYGNTLDRCFFSPSTQGMRIVGDGTYIPTLTHIRDCWFERGAVGTANEKAIEITDVGAHTTIPRNTIITHPHLGLFDYGIYVEYGQKTVIRDVYGSGQNTCDVYLDANATDTEIENGVWTSAAKSIITNNPTRVIRKGLGWENSGTSTGTGAQQTIPHGLLVTPNRIQLTDLESGANPYQSAAADATNIYVLAVLNQDYLWKAWVQ